MKQFIVGIKLIVLALLTLALTLRCGDDYTTVERNIIDAENKVPIYFYATAEQSGENTWRPVFTYLIYSLEEGEYDAYFHAYMIGNSDSVLWSGVQPIQIEGGKKVWGQYVTSAEFHPYMMPDIHPMAYVSVEY